jgi:hypothetical protein
MQFPGHVIVSGPQAGERDREKGGSGTILAVNSRAMLVSALSPNEKVKQASLK